MPLSFSVPLRERGRKTHMWQHLSVRTTFPRIFSTARSARANVEWLRRSQQNSRAFGTSVGGAMQSCRLDPRKHGWGAVGPQGTSTPHCNPPQQTASTDRDDSDRRRLSTQSTSTIPTNHPSENLLTQRPQSKNRAINRLTTGTHSGRATRDCPVVPPSEIS